jgi:hypothetical protein
MAGGRRSTATPFSRSSLRSINGVASPPEHKFKPAIDHRIHPKIYKQTYIFGYYDLVIIDVCRADA